MVRDKIEYLARHGDEYDVLFVGSSRIHSQVMPAIFDRVASENGVPVKSFNAGIAGMNSPEDGYFLEEILRLPHRRLRWVFVELARLGTGLDREETSRFGYWHDTPRLVLAARRLWAEAGERLARAAGGDMVEPMPGLDCDRRGTLGARALLVAARHQSRSRNGRAGSLAARPDPRLRPCQDSGSKARRVAHPGPRPRGNERQRARDLRTDLRRAPRPTRGKRPRRPSQPGGPRAAAGHGDEERRDCRARRAPDDGWKEFFFPRWNASAN